MLDGTARLEAIHKHYTAVDATAIFLLFWFPTNDDDINTRVDLVATELLLLLLGKLTLMQNMVFRACLMVERILSLRPV